jgi:hypothetical protein
MAPVGVKVVDFATRTTPFDQKRSVRPTRCSVRRAYHGRVPTVADGAIDWLTRRWTRLPWHDKPRAVIGRASGCLQRCLVTPNGGCGSHCGTPHHRVHHRVEPVRGNQEARRRSGRRRRVEVGFIGETAVRVTTARANRVRWRPVRAGVTRVSEPNSRYGVHGGPLLLLRGVLGRSPEDLPPGRPQVRDRHLKFHEDRDNLSVPSVVGTAAASRRRLLHGVGCIAPKY